MPETKRYDVSSPVEGKDGKTRWIKCGVGFLQKNKNGINVYLDALPVNGKLSIMPARPGRKQSDSDGDHDPDVGPSDAPF